MTPVLPNTTMGTLTSTPMTTRPNEPWAAPATATVFGGFGQVAPTFGKLPDALVLPAGGLGVRYQMTRNFPMHLRLDYAWGRDGGLLYFSVAEAF